MIITVISLHYDQRIGTYYIIRCVLFAGLQQHFPAEFVVFVALTFQCLIVQSLVFAWVRFVFVCEYVNTYVPLGTGGRNIIFLFALQSLFIISTVTNFSISKSWFCLMFIHVYGLISVSHIPTTHFARKWQHSVS